MNEAPHWHEFNDTTQLAEALASDTARLLTQQIEQRNQADLYVSGGQSPVGFFNSLANILIKWDKINISLVDERCVPHDHADSNTALVKRHLLHAHAGNAHWFDIVDRDGKPTPPPLSPQPQAIAVLGMGEDSHTASLFPDAANISEGLDLTRPADYLQLQPSRAAHLRISLNASALIQMNRLLLLIQGEKKR
ncbi:MAG TPA: 6-phosphogluconolactonase, partial [Pseudomonadales bacterium]|nr:6-phosphogluconolactonase [Pseudomonadales bacterium]